MQKRIQFNEVAGYLGRNGYGNSCALEITNVGKEIFLEPITAVRKQVCQKCRITIPSNRKTLIAFADAILEMATQLPEE